VGSACSHAQPYEMRRWVDAKKVGPASRSEGQSGSGEGHRRADRVQVEPKADPQPAGQTFIGADGALPAVYCLAGAKTACVQPSAAVGAAAMPGSSSAIKWSVRASKPVQPVPAKEAQPTLPWQAVAMSATPTKGEAHLYASRMLADRTNAEAQRSRLTHFAQPSGAIATPAAA